MSAEFLLAADVRLHVVAAAFYAMSTLLAVFGTVLRRQGVSAWSLRIGMAGLVPHTLGIIARWVATGHGPYVTQYENLSAYAWMTVTVFLVLLWRVPKLRSLDLGTWPAAMLLLGVGIYTGPEVGILPPTFTGIWLVLHVTFYFAAFATGLSATTASALILTREHVERVWTGRIAAEDVLDTWAYRLGGLVFAFWGIGMLTGSVWAYYSWGSFWNWDPVETWSLITWVMFGLYLHMRRFFGWKRARAAWLLLVCFGLSIMSLFGTTLLTVTRHSEYFQ